MSLLQVLNYNIPGGMLSTCIVSIEALILYKINVDLAVVGLYMRNFIVTAE